MPLISTRRERTSVWSAAAWLVGLPVVLLMVSLVTGGFLGIDLTGIGTMMLVLGLALSAIDGIAYVRGEDPHGTPKESGGIDVRHLPRGDAQGTYVVVDTRPRSKTGEPRLDEFGPLSYALWFVLVKIPRTVGDLVITGIWKGVARAAGGRKERASDPQRSAIVTAEIGETDRRPPYEEF
jgi:hypothetical protein